MDRSVRKYHTDYNNNPPNPISFIPDIASTSGRLHSEFVCLLFLQAHRESVTAFWNLQEFIFHILPVDSSTTAARRSTVNLGRRLTIFSLRLQHYGWITFDIDGEPLVSRSHTQSSHSQTSRLLTSSLSLGVPVPRTTQCIRGM